MKRLRIDRDADTTIDDRATLWKAEGEDKHTYYGNRLGIIDENTGGLPEVYLVGGNAEVLFKSQ